jgi:hypothetical protein
MIVERLLNDNFETRRGAPFFKKVPLAGGLRRRQSELTACLFARLDHVASFIVNANYSVMRAVVMLRVAISLLIAPRPAYHTRPNGSASEIRSPPQ